MEYKNAHIVTVMNSKMWNSNIPKGESDEEKSLSLITFSLNYNAYWERIVDHRSRRRFFVNETFLRILHEEDKYCRHEKSTIFMPTEKFYLPAHDQTKSEILERFYLKTLDDLRDEYGRYQHSCCKVRDSFPN